jgi:hypothetical protein
MDQVGAIFDGNGLDPDIAWKRAALIRASNTEIEVSIYLFTTENVIGRQELRKILGHIDKRGCEERTSSYDSKDSY